MTGTTRPGSGDNDLNADADSADMLRALSAENARLRELLEYYADTGCELGQSHECCGRLTEDDCSGCKARAALALDLAINAGGPREQSQLVRSAPGVSSTTDPNGWPDPLRRGRPLNPERDGWHWLEWIGDGGPMLLARRWHPIESSYAAERWVWSNGPGWHYEHELSANYRYIGPCLLPEEVTTREAAAEAHGALKQRAKMMVDIIAEGPSIIAEAEASGMEWAAWRVDDDGIGDDRERALRRHLAASIRDAAGRRRAVVSKKEMTARKGDASDE